MPEPDNDLSAEFLAMQILSGPNLDGWQTGEEHRAELLRQFAELHPELEDLAELEHRTRLDAAHWQLLGPDLDWWATQQQDNSEQWQKFIEMNPELENFMRLYPLAEWRDNYMKNSPAFREFLEHAEENSKDWRAFQEWRAQQ